MSNKAFGWVIFLAGCLGGCGGRAAASDPETMNVAGGSGTAGGSGLAGGSSVAGSPSVDAGAVAKCEETSSPDARGGGFETCNGSDMYVHRPTAAACNSELPRANLAPTSTEDQCTADQQCNRAPYGFCDPGATGARECQYGCVTDADCTVGSVCHCGGYIGYCQPGNCTTDSDCGTGFVCAEYWQHCHQQTGFACQTPSDECIVDATCGGDQACELGADGVRRCTAETCDIATGG